jgi:chromate transporter
MSLYLELFVAFFRVGLFTFGGGYAMLPIVKKEIIERKAWITQEQMMDYYGIAQVSMGIIAINTSALIGYQVAKSKGALVAAFSTALPSILVITLIAMFLQPFMNNPIVLNMFSAIRIVVAALITHTAYSLTKKGIIDKRGAVLFVFVLMGIIMLDLSPIILIIASAFFGIIFFPKVEN